MLSKFSPYILTVLVFNVVPILGVAFYEWSPFEMFWLFWMETLIISFFNTIRVLFSQGRLPGTTADHSSMQLQLLPSIKYLVLRVLVFLFYSLFIIVFIGFVAHKEKDPVTVIQTIAFQNFLFNLALVLSIGTNAYYLIRYFFVNGAYQYSKPADYAGIFDGRQIVIHIAVVAGAVGAVFLFERSNNPQYASVWIISIFCIVKCIFEIVLYRRTSISKPIELHY